MTKVLKRILFVFFALLLFAVLAYAFVNLSGISETERKVQSLYEDQLEAIMFSVNQYSQDVIDTWVKDLPLLEEINNEQSRVTDYLLERPPIRGFFIMDSLSQTTYLSEGDSSLVKSDLELMLSENSDLTARLFSYFNSGFQKKEPLVDSKGRAYLIFVTRSNHGSQLSGLHIDPLSFINEVLAPRLETITQEEIILSAFSKDNNELVYSTNEDLFDTDKLSSKKNLWLLPSHQIGISFIGETLEDLVHKRMMTNFIILGIIILILAGGVVLIIRNVNKQVELASMKSDFVSNVSHEIRTPLALISMYAETLDLGRVRDDAQRHDFYKIILAESKRLSGLVNRVLKFSRLEARKYSYHFDELDLNEIVNDVLSSFSFHLTEQKFAVNREQQTIPHTMLDKEAMETAVFNVFDNAVKYSGESKEIDITTGVNDDCVFVSITDYGIGMTKSEQKKVYDKFYRVESALVHKTKGSGLGLNLVHEIVKDHHGKVHLESEPAKGSTFTIYIPITKKAND